MNRTVLTQIPDSLSANSYKLVLTPTKAIARSLKVSHRTLESVAETIIKKNGLRIASSLVARRTIQNAISEVLKVRDVAGITNLWTPIIQEFISSGNELSILQKHPVNRVSKIAKVTLFYQEQLRKNNYIDRSELFWLAAQYCQQPKSCFFYGYFILKKDILALINALSGNQSLLVLPWEDNPIFCSNQVHLEWLKAQNWQIKNVDLPDNKKQFLGQQLGQYYWHQQQLPTGVIFNHYPNLVAEVKGVLTQVKLLLDRGISPQEIVITTKNEQLYGETLLDIAWQYDLPIRAFYDVAFLTTRMGAWLQLLLSILKEINDTEQVSFELVTKLLSHSLVKQLNPQKWTAARQEYPQTIEQWQAIEVDLSVLRLPSKAKSDRWILIIQNILETFGILQNAKPWAKEVVAYYKFQEALQELLLTTNKVISKQQIISELDELVASLTIPIQPGRGGVELHSPSSLFGSHYQYVFVLGMAENIFPTQITDDLVLSYSDRKQLAQENINLNTIAKIVQQENLAFYFLLQIPRQQIIFSYPQTIDKNPCYPSPYITSLNLISQPATTNYVASIEEARIIYLQQKNNFSDNLLALIHHKWQIELNRINNVENEYSGIVNIALNPQQFTFSASQLTKLGQCPFKWWSDKILKLKEIAEVNLVLEPHTKGSLYHQCLELCLAQVDTAADLKQFNQQQLQQAFIAAENKLALSKVTAWQHQKQELIDLLYLNLKSSEFLPPDHQVIALEQEFTTTWYDLKIKGTIDRIDCTATGIKVIDYKSSSSTPIGIKDESGKANIDIQIPLYVDAVAQKYPQENIDAVYYSLSKCQPIKRQKSDSANLESFAQKVKMHLEQGSYPIEPDIQFKACNYCQFDLVCRKKK